MCIGADNSIVLCGYSNSANSGNKTSASFGGYDYWIVKLDANGNILWNKTYGGSKDDFAAAIINTADGGYLVGGSSISNKTGSKSSNSYGQSFDYWVLKLSADGSKVWDQTIGGNSTEKLTSLAEMPKSLFLLDGVYIIGGYSYSNNNGYKTKANLGPENNSDYWTVLLNKDGSQNSQHIFGSTGHDVLTNVSPAGSTSFYAAGYSYSDKSVGNKTQNTFGNNDYWLIRSSLQGVYEYQGNFGSTLSDFLTCMQVLPNGSLVLGGYSNSDQANSKTGAFFGVTDYWLVKLKPDGTKQWDRTFGGINDDYMTAVQQTKDKGFITGGYSNSNTGKTKTTNSRGVQDYWLVKTDSLGNVQWDKTIGGSRGDTLTAIYEIAANDYIVAGTSNSPISGDKSSGVIGGNLATDFWVMRLKPTASLTGKTSITNTSATGKTADAGDNYELEIMPNPVSDVLTIRYRAAAESKVSFVIYDVGGKAVLQSALNAGLAKQPSLQYCQPARRKLFCSNVRRRKKTNKCIHQRIKIVRALHKIQAFTFMVKACVLLCDSADLFIRMLLIFSFRHPKSSIRQKKQDGRSVG
jgi:hypothetical protein